MKRLLLSLAFTFSLLGSPIAISAERTVKLSVPGMFCASCPYIVKKAISAVKGVQAVKARIKDRTAIVRFDDSMTNINAIQKATGDVGYPSTVLKASGT